MSTDANQNLLNRIANRYGVGTGKLWETLKATAFRQQGDKPIQDSEMIALLIVADQYGLNPFTREIYAFPDKKGIVPIVGIDGWVAIVNRHPSYDGCEFNYSDTIDEMDEAAKACPSWVECVMYRKDRSHAIVVREYLDECYRPPTKRNDGSTVRGPWQTHTKRFLRHRAFMQCARVSFGFSGIYDEQEAEEITGRSVIDVDSTPVDRPARVSGAKRKLDALASPDADPADEAAQTAREIDESMAQQADSTVADKVPVGGLFGDDE